MAAMLWLMTVLACSEVGPPPREHPADRKTVAQTDAEAISQMTASANGSGAPQVVALIVLDTVRADHLDVYGYATETMPKLRDWSKGATVYESARSPSSWTLPAHASLFTGQLPRTHGSRGRAPGTRAALPAPPLAADADTIAEAFQAAGWNTVAVVANKGFMSPIFGLDQGFDHYLNQQFVTTEGPPYPTADRITDAAIAAVSAPWDGPLFLFVNYMDAHQPWIRSWPSKRPEDDQWLPGTTTYDRVVTDLLAKVSEAPAPAITVWNAAYDAELTFLDGHLSRLLEALDHRQAWTAVTSDHGEFLGEHHLIEHSKDLYDEVVRVPLIVKGPDVSSGREATPVMMHDAANWALTSAGLSPLVSTDKRPDGLQVSELYWTRQKDLNHPAFGQRFARTRRLFVYNQHALMVSDRDTPELYDLVADPQMRTPLVTPQWQQELVDVSRLWSGAQAEPDDAKVWRWPEP